MPSTEHELKELIVTQWDVNYTGDKSGTAQALELIVTQWDVNSITASVQGLYDLELIVTQWDVNLAKDKDFVKYAKN